MSRAPRREGYVLLEGEPSTSSPAELPPARYKLRHRPSSSAEVRNRPPEPAGHTSGLPTLRESRESSLSQITVQQERGPANVRFQGPSVGVPTLKRTSSAGTKALGSLLAPQLPQTVRQRDKFVPLPLDKQQEQESREGSEPEDVVAPAVDEELAPQIPKPVRAPTSGSGRITVYCTADSLDQPALEQRIRERHPEWRLVSLPDEVLHATLPPSMHIPSKAIAIGGGATGNGTGEGGKALPDGGGSGSAFAAPAVQGQAGSGSSNTSLVQDIFFFGYGVIAFWGLTPVQEQNVMVNLVKPCEVGSLPEADVDIDEFTYVYSGHAAPNIQNDTITISRRAAADSQVRLAISHALAQSTKLSVYEERVVALVEESRHLPQDLARHGRVSMPTRHLAQLIGKVFLQSSNVNLLSSVLDTPDYFWSAPDNLQALYERALEYLELETRVQVLNARFAVLQEMLDMLRDHKNNSHAARLEWIIIWLLCIDVVLMLFQLLSLFKFV